MQKKYGQNKWVPDIVSSRTKKGPEAILPEKKQNTLLIIFFCAKIGRHRTTLNYEL